MPDLAALPERADLLVVAVAASRVPEALQQVIEEKKAEGTTTVETTTTYSHLTMIKQTLKARIDQIRCCASREQPRMSVKDRAKQNGISQFNKPMNERKPI